MIRRFLITLTLALALAACSENKDTAHEESDGHDHGSEAEGAVFAEGKGILLMDETKKAIGLEMAEAEERELTPRISIEAQIYRAASEPSRASAEQTGSAYAAALVSPEAAKLLAPGDTATVVVGGTEKPATVWRIDPTSRDAVANEEVILRIPDGGNALRVGEFVSGFVQSKSSGSVVAVPRTAVLETATGKFVFVENGEHLIRTPVTTGAESADFVEITDGLYSGDVVASKPAETLYLIELRATKGGGHCH